MRDVTVVSKVKHNLVTITHRVADPGFWIVQRWKTSMGFKKLISADWFNDPAQAAAFAGGMVRGT